MGVQLRSLYNLSVGKKKNKKIILQIQQLVQTTYDGAKQHPEDEMVPTAKKFCITNSKEQKHVFLFFLFFSFLLSS